MNQPGNQGPLPAPPPLKQRSDSGYREQDEVITTLVPYRNSMALASYYLGVFTLVPGLGLILVLPAFICGVVGLRAASRNPEVRGKVHAWIGIVLALVIGLAQLMVVALIIASITAQEWN